MSHPEISSLIHKRDTAHNLLYNENKPTQAMKQMIGIILELEKKHRPQTLYDKIKQRYNYLRITQKTDPVTYQQKAEELFHEHCEWLGELNEVLWTHSYLFNKRYGAPEIKLDTTFGTDIKPWNE
jgi:hypothetical protein